MTVLGITVFIVRVITVFGKTSKGQLPKFVECKDDREIYQVLSFPISLIPVPLECSVAFHLKH
jgi:hypothetical protein